MRLSVEKLNAMLMRAEAASESDRLHVWLSEGGIALASQSYASGVREWCGDNLDTEGFTVSLKALSKTVAKLGKEAEIRLWEKDERLLISSKGSRYSFAQLSGNLPSSLTAPTDGVDVALPPAEWLRLLSVASCAPVASGRPQLDGVVVESDGKRLCGSACDGRRVARAFVDKAALPFRFMVSSDVVGAVVKFLRTVSSETVNARVGVKKLMFVGRVDRSVTWLEVKAPYIEKFFPHWDLLRVGQLASGVSKTALLAALVRASNLSVTGTIGLMGGGVAVVFGADLATGEDLVGWTQGLGEAKERYETPATLKIHFAHAADTIKCLDGADVLLGIARDMLVFSGETAEGGILGMA